MYLAGEKSNRNFVLRTIGSDGRAVVSREPFAASLFLESQSNKDEYVGFKTSKPLKKFDFSSNDEFKEFRDKFEGRIYGDVDPVIQKFSTMKVDSNDSSKIESWGIDIEVYSREEFPYPSRAKKFPVTCVSLTRFFDGSVYTWVLDPDNRLTLESTDDWRISAFPDEESMLLDLVGFVRSNFDKIHVLTGWNSQDYDVPYLVYRLNHLTEGSTEDLSPEVKKLSPFGWLTKSRRTGRFSIAGLPHLDYLELFKKFTLFVKKYPSYKLDEICQEELGKGKHRRDPKFKSLADLYDGDLDAYVRYNKNDVVILKELDDKFKFIKLAVGMAYFCKMKFEQVFSPVASWETLMYNELKKIGVVPFPRKDPIKEEYMGAYVKEPKVGLSKDLMVFDLTSLYPSVIMAMNISPETILKENEEKATIDSFLNGFVPTDRHLKNEIVDPAGYVYTKEKIGIVPTLMKALFERRMNIKKDLKKIKKEIAYYEDLLKSTKG